MITTRACACALPGRHTYVAALCLVLGTYALLEGAAAAQARDSVHLLPYSAVTLPVRSRHAGGRRRVGGLDRTGELKGGPLGGEGSRGSQPLPQPQPELQPTP